MIDPLHRRNLFAEQAGRHGWNVVLREIDGWHEVVAHVEDDGHQLYVVAAWHPSIRGGQQRRSAKGWTWEFMVDEAERWGNQSRRETLAILQQKTEHPRIAKRIWFNIDKENA